MPHSRVCIALFVLFSGLAHADTTPVWPPNLPDAGALIRQTEQMLKQEQMQRNAQQHQGYAPAITMNDATSVTPKTINFLGVKLIPAADLQEVAAPYLNRKLDQHDLQRLTDAAVALYRKQGWLVRVYIPKQDLSQSELTVQVLENMPSSAR